MSVRLYEKAFEKFKHLYSLPTDPKRISSGILPLVDIMCKDFHIENQRMVRTNRSQMFLKIGVL